MNLLCYPFAVFVVIGLCSIGFKIGENSSKPAPVSKPSFAQVETSMMKLAKLNAKPGDIVTIGTGNSDKPEYIFVVCQPDSHVKGVPYEISDGQSKFLLPPHMDMKNWRVVKSDDPNNGTADAYKTLACSFIQFREAGVPPPK